MVKGYKLLIPIIVVIFSFTLFYQVNTNSDNHTLGVQNSPNRAQDDVPFEITGTVPQGFHASYIGLFYMDGYEYLQSGWHSYSWLEWLGISKGEKIGEVTLDLKDIHYTGTPPDFASTFDVGTEVYTVDGRKPEYSIMLVDPYGNVFVLYRMGKGYLGDNSSLNLTVSQVIDMIAASGKVTAVELRDIEDGSWLQTSRDEQLISLINNELLEQVLLGEEELNQYPFDYTYSIPVNIVLEAGEILYLHVIPEVELAYVFGAFVQLSPTLTSALQDLYNAGSHLSNILDLLPYEDDEVDYLYFKNHTNGDEILCENPQWSHGALYQIFRYYRVVETNIKIGELAVTIILGKTEQDSVSVKMYMAADPDDKSMVIEIQGKKYKPVTCNIDFVEIENFLYNYTDLGY